MKLTDEQRKIGIKYSIMQLLSTDIRNKRYNELQKIYESLNLRNNDKLVTKLSEERTLGALFTRSVYTDILFVIADYINDRQEIADLKRRLEYQELFISELNKPEVEEVNNTYDLELLQSKRYLFVGHISDALPDLKYKFLNSIFMESETAHISNIEVDAVVMLIKWMSHSMFYKVKATGSLTDKKIIMCNTKNIDTVLQKMYNEIL